MAANSLVFPMLALVLLTFVVAAVLFRARVRSVREGHLPISYFRTFQGFQEPDYLAKASRHFVNLFEVPSLFYAGCLAAMVTGTTGPWVTGFAWGYVLARIAHAAIHLGSNRVRHRLRAYAASWFFLLALWIHVAVRLVTTD
jgi:hypothetical protein